LIQRNHLLRYQHYETIQCKCLPFNINNVGILVNDFFESNYFDAIQTAHEFQQLTESNKDTPAYRTGVYITNVYDTDKGRKYNLLRCSSNFTGPTHGYRDIDRKIVNKVNDFVNSFYSNPGTLNHVLAQIYHNTNGKKASIKRHSDKTKDMQKNGLLAFCSFYNTDDVEPLEMTKMRFRLKNDVTGDYVKQFDVTFAPNSLFVINLEMNRLYTHEIIPGKLEANKLPTRMGYVIRSSDTIATWKDDKVYIDNVEMVPPYSEGIKRLKDIYYEENMTSNKVTYSGFDFSLNEGDYMKPLI
jgi:hypothetical protein